VRTLLADLERCPSCGGELKIIAAILEAPVIECISRPLACRPERHRGHRHAS